MYRDMAPWLRNTELIGSFVVEDEIWVQQINTKPVKVSERKA